MTKETVAEECRATADVIKSSAVAPLAIPTKDEVSADLQIVAEVLQRQNWDQVVASFQYLHDPSVSKSLGCTFGADFYDKILTLPTERSGKLLRYLHSK